MCDEPPVGAERVVSSPGDASVHHIYTFLLMDTWGHVSKKWGRSSFFPNHVSDEMKGPRRF